MTEIPKIPKYCRICAHNNNNEECLYHEDYPKFVKNCEALEFNPYMLADLLDLLIKREE